MYSARTPNTAGGTPALPIFKWWPFALVAVCKDLDLVWVWFYKDVAPMVLK
jgi:hypothetical protein